MYFKSRILKLLLLFALCCVTFCHTTSPIISKYNPMLIKLNSVVSSKIIKRPSAIVKSPYVADVRLEGDNNEVLAHCPALGCCGLSDNGATVWMTKIPQKDDTNESKKCKYRVCLAEVHDEVRNHRCLVGLHPRFAEDACVQALSTNQLSILQNIKSFRRETFIKIDELNEDSRFDITGIDANNQPFIIEVKNVPLADYEDISTKDKKKYKVTYDTTRPFQSKIAYFPDGYRKASEESISPRALKHLRTLTHIKKVNYNNTRCILCFVIQRNDISSFTPSIIDPVYREAFYNAIDAGVEIITMVVEWKIIPSSSSSSSSSSSLSMANTPSTNETNTNKDTDSNVNVTDSTNNTTSCSSSSSKRRKSKAMTNEKEKNDSNQPSEGYCAEAYLVCDNLPIVSREVVPYHKQLEQQQRLREQPSVETMKKKKVKITAITDTTKNISVNCDISSSSSSSTGKRKRKGASVNDNNITTANNSEDSDIINKSIDKIMGKKVKKSDNKVVKSVDTVVSIDPNIIDNSADNTTSDPHISSESMDESSHTKEKDMTNNTLEIQEQANTLRRSRRKKTT